MLEHLNESLFHVMRNLKVCVREVGSEPLAGKGLEGSTARLIAGEEASRNAG